MSHLSDDDSLLGEPVLTVRVESRADRCVAYLVGELDVSSAPQLREELHRLIAGSAAATLVLELSGLTFCDARGLGTIVSARKAADAAGKELVLIGARPAVRRLLRLTRLDRALDVR